MKTVLIEHDNGIEGQHGFSEEKIVSDSEIRTIIKNYEKCGITIYRWEFH